MFGLDRRRLVPEQMDDPALATHCHHAALRGLARINWISRSAAIVWPAIRELARARPDQPIRVLDVATGGGDVPIAIARRARQHGIRLELHACDLSPTALRYAAERATTAGIGIEFFQTDVLRERLPRAYDVVMTSLFLHHLADDEAAAALRTLADAARARLLVNDLRRCVLGFAAAWIGTRLLSRSPIVHSDGPQSVRAAFSLAEVAALARTAGLADARVARRFPFRFLLDWRRG